VRESGFLLLMYVHLLVLLFLPVSVSFSLLLLRGCPLVLWSLDLTRRRREEIGSETGQCRREKKVVFLPSPKENTAFRLSLPYLSLAKFLTKPYSIHPTREVSKKKHNE